MTDKQLHDEILAELEFEPEVHPERIGVSVENGVVALSGHVDSYSQKLAAERVVKRVYSARAVVNDLEVRLPARDEVADADLAEAAVRAIDGLGQIPRDSLRVTVRDAHVVLDGEVKCHFQREVAESAVRHLRGVRGVLNHITLWKTASPVEVHELIAAALRRSEEVEDGAITIASFDGRVTLHGTVSSIRERDAAELAAWRAPGVTHVENQLEILP